ncbi:MAG: hypothetical protein COA40_13795 [Aequorivita sp.]|nr:MAG: hypothetical protein COA40_13795 [Aequorivita sp.]
MKKVLIVFSILFINSHIAHSQEDYMTKIVEKSCQCLADMPNNEELSSTSIGLCMINEANIYKAELLRDHGINMDEIHNDGEKLGKLIAIEMITVCPEQMKRIASNIEAKKSSDQDNSLQSIQGVIKSIDKNEFITFSVTSSDGKTSKFYWLTFIESKNDLQNEFDSYNKKKVEIEYTIFEFYDPKLKEYRNYNVIESLNIID